MKTKMRKEMPKKWSLTCTRPYSYSKSKDEGEIDLKNRLYMPDRPNCNAVGKFESK